MAADGTGDDAAAIGTLMDPMARTPTGVASAPASVSVWHQRFSHTVIESLLSTLDAAEGIHLSRKTLEEI